MHFSSIFLSALSLISFSVSALPTNGSPPPILGSPSQSGVSELNVGDVFEGFQRGSLLVYEKLDEKNKKYSYKVIWCFQKNRAHNALDPYIPLDSIAVTRNGEPIRNWFASVRLHNVFPITLEQKDFSKITLLFNIPPRNMPEFRQDVDKMTKKEEAHERFSNVLKSGSLSTWKG